MKYDPYEYQKYAIHFIEEKPEAAIFLDCGMGKTSISLSAIDHLLFDSFEVHRVLVIAPIRVGRFAWPDELRKWDHLSGLTFAVAVGTPKQRMEALESGAGSQTEGQIPKVENWKTLFNLEGTHPSGRETGV